MLFANAVNRPYRENSEIVDSLHRDGIKFFTVSTPSSFRSGCQFIMQKIGTSIPEIYKSSVNDLQFGKCASTLSSFGELR